MGLRRAGVPPRLRQKNRPLQTVFGDIHGTEVAVSMNYGNWPYDDPLIGHSSGEHSVTIGGSLPRWAILAGAAVIGLNSIDSLAEV